jgi:hypothetical protein
MPDSGTMARRLGDTNCVSMRWRVSREGRKRGHETSPVHMTRYASARQKQNRPFSLGFTSFDDGLSGGKTTLILTINSTQARTPATWCLLDWHRAHTAQTSPLQPGLLARQAQDVSRLC